MIRMSHIIHSPLITQNKDNLGMFPVGFFSRMKHAQEAFVKYFLNEGKDGFIQIDEAIKEWEITEVEE